MYVANTTQRQIERGGLLTSSLFFLYTTSPRDTLGVSWALFFVTRLFVKLLNDLSSQLFKLIGFFAHIISWRVPGIYKVPQYAYLVIEVGNA